MKYRPALLTLLMLSLFATHAPADVVQDADGHTFRLDVSTWTDRPRTVHLAGDFNGWSTTATPMASQGGGGQVWTATVKGLTEGRHLYKFVVNGDRWIPDPTGDKELEEDDGHGGKNSAFLVGPDIRKAPPPKPNEINDDFLRHNPQIDVRATEEGKAMVGVEAQAGDAERVIVFYGPRDGARFTSRGAAEMVKVGTEGGYDRFEAEVNSIGEAEHVYFFRFVDGRRVLDFAGDGAVPDERGVVARTVDGMLSGMPNPPAGAWPLTFARFDVPDWAKSAVWYQVFPDRFRNGNPANDPGAYPYERLVPWNGDWWSALPGEAPGESNFYQGEGNVWKRRYGGDIQGIREKLGYLRSLGATAIYLNPIFEAESMHKYDTADFRHVDDNFGLGEPPLDANGNPLSREQSERPTTTAVYPYRVKWESGTDPETWGWSESDKLFLDFIKEAHAQGFKVIVDGVFNHVGRAHPFFMDVLEKGKQSEYADWFEITDWGDPKNWRKMDDPFAVHGKAGGIQWVAWDRANGSLPVFKKDAKLGLAPGPRDHIFAITKRWLDPDGDAATRDGVDGWRLDVPGDIPHPFWRDWRKVVKEANPDAYIVGEIWNWAQPWLQGDQFDAVMNYQFAMAAQDFFVDQKTAIKPSEFAQRLERVANTYAWPIALAQQNLMGSHDTDRLASMFVNPDRPYDGANRPQDNAREFNGPPYSPRKPTDEEWARLRQLVAFQHAFVGAPMTYYGDEAGMWGPDDPSNRQPFPWPDKGPYANGVGFDEGLFQHFQRAIAIRNALPPLQRGRFRTVMADDARDLYAFARELDGQIVYVVLNRGSGEQAVELTVEPGRYVDYMDPAQATASFNDVDPTARPQIRPAAGAGTASDGDTLRLRLAPHGTAILVKQ